MRNRCTGVLVATILVAATTGWSDVIGDFEGGMEPGWVVTGGASGNVV